MFPMEYRDSNSVILIFYDSNIFKVYSFAHTHTHTHRKDSVLMKYCMSALNNVLHLRTFSIGFTGLVSRRVFLIRRESKDAYNEPDRV